MNQPPFITIVTCSFQQARFLEATIRSVVAQDYPNFEYIVVDGGSTDGSREIIEKYASSLSWWRSERDAGQSDALIKGFARARGDVFAWLCSDDILLPNALAKIAAFFVRNAEAMTVFGDALWIDVHGKPLRTKREMDFSRFVLLCDHSFIPQPSMFFRRSLYEDVGGLRLDLQMTMDFDLWERFSRKATIEHMREYLSCMRFYPEQKTRASSMIEVSRTEATAVRARGVHHWPPLIRSLGACGALTPFAKLLRVLARARRGGYTSSVPPEIAQY